MLYYILIKYFDMLLFFNGSFSFFGSSHLEIVLNKIILVFIFF